MSEKKVLAHFKMNQFFKDRNKNINMPYRIKERKKNEWRKETEITKEDL